MSSLSGPVPLSEEGETDLVRVRRINQGWIVHGHLRATASAWIEHLQATDPERLEKSCWLALFLTHRQQTESRDPKPLFYAGLFAFATRAEIERFLPLHRMTRAITLLGLGDASGLDVLGRLGSKLAIGIAGEIRSVLSCE